MVNKHLWWTAVWLNTWYMMLYWIYFTLYGNWSFRISGGFWNVSSLYDFLLKLLALNVVICELCRNYWQAKKFYESALRLEPGYLGAALALAELHVIEGRNGDAVSLLERYLKDWADDSLHVKLAQVFAATNMLQEALSHYQAALRLNLYRFVWFWFYWWLQTNW